MAWLHLPPPAFSTCFQLGLVFLLCLFLRARVAAQDRKNEVRILLSFKEKSILDYGDQLYWNYWKETDANPCAWVGVICTDNATVWELDFNSWGINSVPGLEILAELPDLRQLDLSYNYLTDFPETIGTLTRLTLLDLSGNYINGSIPANISACTSLRLLSLSDNDYSGDMIFNFSTLVHLQSLDLSLNQFSGTFPNELGALTSLDSLDLSNNNLKGRIPDLRDLTNLFYLNLSANSFEGFEQLWSLGDNSTLNQFDVSFNLLEGTIPPTLTHKLNLTWLDLSSNRLSGGIPPGMLQSSTRLSTSSSSCSYLNLSNNLLTGSLPMDGVKDSCFDVLDLSNNNLTGGLPRKFFHFIPVVSYFGIQNNQFTGDLVNVLLGTGWHYTAELRFQDNLFTGDLSRIVKNHTGAPNGLVEILDLSNNDLGWSMSTAIPDPVAATLESFGGLFGGLLELRLGGNNFSGTSLPSTCFVNPSLGQNSLSVLDLSSSYLQGEISSAVFQSSCVPSLQYLNLSNNDLTGRVPESIILLPNLTVLDLSVNHLSGSLPNISLRSNLFNPSFFQGNDGLCGYPLRECPKDVRGPSVSWWQMLIIIIGSLTTALGSCLVASWRWRVYHKRHQQDADLIKTLMERDSATLMSLRELRKATNNFAIGAQIGEGGFGTVYAGTLDDGTLVAIKRSKREGHENDKQQFLNEIRILSHVNHRNLVKLLGCCMENKVSLLVFEFVSNGTLQEHLRGKVGDARLSWKQRLKIAVQTADALNYLHSATKCPIYHRDVKAANILLDENLNAKVADFGISKLASFEATHVSTVGMGTMGYVDPEYYVSYQLTNKSDVYSFGVVLLELISAKHVIDAERGEDETSLVIYASRHINSGDLQQFVDPSLIQMYNDPSGLGKDSMLRVGRLAMKCLDLESKARPSMIEVLKELQDLWLELNNTSLLLDSIHEEDEEDSSRDNIGLLSRRFSSNSFEYSTNTADSSIEMSQFTRSVSCK